MARTQPKKNVTFVRMRDVPMGNAVRMEYPKVILENAPTLPKPLEYADIDDAFRDFVDRDIPMTAGGKDVPTFTLYSSQRFSEYSQTWQHTDADGNLLMNFKTVNRDSDPGFGKNQGGLWNVPGNRQYPMLHRVVMGDNGQEYYETYSMRQPYAVDLSYRVNFVTNLYYSINDFNQRVNELFKARQHYIRPNGHFIPLVIDEINDETQYTIEDRKFYVQSVSIKALAYIIHEGDFKVERRPMRPTLSMEGDAPRRKVTVDVSEFEDNDLENKSVDISVSFAAWHDKAEFDIDCEVVVESVETENVRNLRVSVNGTPTYAEKGFKLHDGDNVKLRIRTVDVSKASSVVFHGYDPDSVYHADTVPEKVSDEPVKHEDIVVE